MIAADMLRAQATLTAGPNQWRYAPGAKVRAILYARVESPKQLTARTFSILAERGWARVSIDACARVTNLENITGSYTAEAEAARLARDTGFGIVVLGLVQ